MSAGEADLAFALIDGSVSLLRVRRKALRIDTGSLRWGIESEGPRVLDGGDKRAITALQWIEVSREPLNSILILTRGRKGF